MATFPIVDEYTGARLGISLSEVPEGDTAVIESTRRLSPELSYGFVHALWWVWLADERSVVSVPPGAAQKVSDL